MAGSIAYVSFPRFTKNRQSIMSTMYRRFLEALLTLTGTGSCFSRPARSLEDSSSKDTVQTRTVNAKPHGFATQSAISPNQQFAAEPSHSSSSSEQDRVRNLHILTRRTSSSSNSSSSTTTPTSSLRSLPSTLRATLTRRISSWQTNHSDPWPLEEPTENQTTTSFENTATTPSETESNNEDLIASLDALALSQHEREVLSRMQLVCRSARATRERRLEPQDWNDFNETSSIESGLCLRGGGDDDDNVRPFRTPRRRTSLPVSEPVFPKPDSARPPRGLWWLAGGRKGQVPTLGELRVRKEVERENRKIVGFWGTVLGVRRLGRVGILGEGEGDGGGDVEGDADAGGGDDTGVGEGVLENADAGSSHRSKSIGSIVGAPGAGGGGSLASSHREREVEVDQPVEVKVKSVASAAGSTKQSKAGSPNGTVEDQGSARSRSIKDSGAAEPKGGSESAESVAEDHESTKTGSVKDAGAEEPKARSESLKSSAEETGVAEAESVRGREGVAETVGETEAKSSSDG